MEVYRISQLPYANDLSGQGAKLYGGRWNKPGYPMLYTSANRSLALLETLVHMPAVMLQEKIYIISTIQIPDSIIIQQFLKNKLPEGWNDRTREELTKEIGTRFLVNAKFLAAQVPSIILNQENNIIINPLHTSHGKLKITHQERIVFDERLPLLAGVS